MKKSKKKRYTAKSLYRNWKVQTKKNTKCLKKHHFRRTSKQNLTSDFLSKLALVKSLVYATCVADMISASGPRWSRAKFMLVGSGQKTKQNDRRILIGDTCDELWTGAVVKIDFYCLKNAETSSLRLEMTVDIFFMIV